MPVKLRWRKRDTTTSPVVPVISDIVAAEVTPTSWRVNWNVSPASEGQVVYDTVAHANLSDYAFATTREFNLLGFHSQPLNGLSAATTYHYRVRAWGPDGTPSSSADATFETAGTPSVPVTTSTYGPGVGGDSLANTSWRGAGYSHGWVFRVPYTASLTAFMGYWLGPPDPGYAEGTGGTYQIRVWNVSESTGFPTGSPLLTMNFPAWGASGSFDVDRRIVLSSSVAMIEGNRYAITTTNTDANPTVNFCAWDDYCYGYFQADNDPPLSGGRLNPRFPAGDWETILSFNNGSSWSHRDGFYPVLELEFSNGLSYGMSYGENDSQSESTTGRIEGSSYKVREIFTPTSNVSTTGAGIRLLRASGSGDLTVALKTAAGSTIDSFTVAASSIAVGSVPGQSDPGWTNLGRGATWQVGTWAATRTLNAGTQYVLELSCPSGTRYWAWAFRKLSTNYNYTSRTSFEEGWCEKTTDGSTWTVLGDEAPSHNSDLQFFLALP